MTDSENLEGHRDIHQGKMFDNLLTNVSIQPHP